MPRLEYHKHPYDGSNSLKMILQTPADYIVAKSLPSAETEAMRFGIMVHCAVLETEMFYDRYVPQEEDWGSLAANPGRQKWEALKRHAALTGKKVISHSDYLKIKKIWRAVQSNASLKDLLKDGIFETECYDDDQEVKARADLIDRSGMIWDLKTISGGITQKDMEWAVHRWGMAFQAAHYCEVFKKDRFGWIFISTDKPAVHILIRRASDSVLEEGRRQFHKALQLRNECREKGIWPGYGDEIKEINLLLSALTSCD